MANFAELWEDTAPKPSGNVKIAPETQSKRDSIALSMIQNELADTQKRLASVTDPQAQARYQADIAGLQREIGRMTKQKPIAAATEPPAPAAAAPSSGSFADLWEATSPSAPSEPSTAGAGHGSYEGYSQAGEAGGKVKAAPITVQGAIEQPIPTVRKILGKALQAGFEGRKQLGEAVAGAIEPYVRPVYEVGGTLLGGAAGSVLGPAGGIISTIQSGKLGTPEGIKIGQQKAEDIQRALMPEVTTPTGQAVLGGLQKGFEATKLPPNVMPEVSGFAPLVKPATQTAIAPVVKGAEKVAEAAKQTKVGQQLTEAAREMELVKSGQVAPQSVGAAAVPDAATIQQAMSVVSPELQQTISKIPVNKVNLPVLQRHIEADTLPVPVRLTEGQATGDVVKLSQEQNRRGRDPELAQRFNEQNGQLINNLEAFRDRAAPDAPGSRIIDHGQGIIDAYKELDNKLNTNIDSKYQSLRDAAGGQFPVDAPKLLENVNAKLKKELLSNEAPAGQYKELTRLANENNMTFEDYLSLRRNLGDVARTSTDGSVRKAAGYMIEELEKLPLQKDAAALKPLADEARKAAKERFDMLKRDPAYRAVVDDTAPAEKFIEKFVINGHNKNVQSMINHLGQDSVARQHMSAGAINYLRDRAGIVDGQGNFSQAGYNKALKFLDDSNKMPLIFDGETSTGLKTLGNVARYTQAQPRGSFVNNSNTLVGAMAEKAKALVGGAVEKGMNVAAPGLQLGTSLMETRARRAAEAETKKALELGAGIKK